MKKILILNCAFLCLGLLCSCSTPKYEISVYLSPDLKKQYKIYPSLEVDVIGIAENDQSLFASQTVDEYFQPDSPFRKNLKHVTLHFSEENSVPKCLKKKNPVWKIFKTDNVKTIGLMVNLPISGKKATRQEFRKFSIPLKTSLFSNDDRYFMITDQGFIRLEKAPKNAAAPKEDGFLPKEDEQ